MRDRKSKVASYIDKPYRLWIYQHFLKISIRPFLEILISIRPFLKILISIIDKGILESVDINIDIHKIEVEHV